MTSFGIEKNQPVINLFLAIHEFVELYMPSVVYLSFMKSLGLLSHFSYTLFFIPYTLLSPFFVSFEVFWFVFFFLREED